MNRQVIGHRSVDAHSGRAAQVNQAHIGGSGDGASDRRLVVGNVVIISSVNLGNGFQYA